MNSYKYDANCDQWISDNPELFPIKKGHTIRYKIMELRFVDNSFSATSQIQDNFLGITNNN